VVLFDTKIKKKRQRYSSALYTNITKQINYETGVSQSKTKLLKKILLRPVKLNLIDCIEPLFGKRKKPQ